MNSMIAKYNIRVINNVVLMTELEVRNIQILQICHLERRKKFLKLLIKFNNCIRKLDTNTTFIKYKQDILIHMINYLESNIFSYIIENSNQALEIILEVILKSVINKFFLMKK